MPLLISPLDYGGFIGEAGLLNGNKRAQFPSVNLQGNFIEQLGGVVGGVGGRPSLSFAAWLRGQRGAKSPSVRWERSGHEGSGRAPL